MSSSRGELHLCGTGLSFYETICHTSVRLPVCQQNVRNAVTPASLKALRLRLQHLHIATTSCNFHGVFWSIVRISIECPIDILPACTVQLRAGPLFFLCLHWLVLEFILSCVSAKLKSCKNTSSLVVVDGFLQILSASTRLGTTHLRRAKGRRQSHSQNHDPHTIAAAVRSLSSASRRRT